jgi:hypothetical protein
MFMSRCAEQLKGDAAGALLLVLLLLTLTLSCAPTGGRKGSGGDNR